MTDRVLIADASRVTPSQFLDAVLGERQDDYRTLLRELVTLCLDSVENGTDNSQEEAVIRERMGDVLRTRAASLRPQSATPFSQSGIAIAGGK